MASNLDASTGNSHHPESCPPIPPSFCAKSRLLANEPPPGSEKGKDLCGIWEEASETQEESSALPAENPFCSSVCHGTSCQCSHEGSSHALVGDGVSDQPRAALHTPLESLEAAGHALRAILSRAMVSQGTYAARCSQGHSDPVRSLSSSSTAANCAAGPFAASHTSKNLRIQAMTGRGRRIDQLPKYTQRKARLC